MQSKDNSGKKNLARTDLSITVLTIEDDRVLRETVAAYLEDRLFKVLQAENGSEGLDLFRKKQPDAVLLDLRMPGVDGLDILEAMRKESPNTPVIIVSGAGDTKDVVESLRRGAWNYILKPILDMGYLLHALESALERASLIKKNREYQKYLEDMVRDRTFDLQTTNKKLRREIERREAAQQEREKLIERLETQNVELEQFAYTVSHDLKSPLVTLKGYMGLLREDLAGGANEEVEYDIIRMTDAVDKMSKLLHELLVLAQIGRVVNPPKIVSMTELANEAAEIIKEQFIGKDISIVTDPAMPNAFADRSRMLEALKNLIDNAVRYIGDQTSPQIEIGCRAGDNETVFFVRDNGIGIDKQYQQKVFGLFEKLNPKTDGSGVGLALVKRIIEVHGGQIWVESDGLGRGSTFCFVLPEENLRS